MRILVASGLNYKIFKYEASRPDATASSSGVLSTGQACSVAGRLPWPNIANTFPYGTTFQAQTCNGRAYDVNEDRVLATDQPCK